MPSWMIVEDERDLQDVLLRMFELWGVDGVAFYNGDTAIHWIENFDSGEFPDYDPKLALVDIRLPGTSGLDICARLRQSPKLQDIPIVLMTAYRMSPEDEQEALRVSAANMLIYKPLPHLGEFKSLLTDLVKP